MAVPMAGVGSYTFHPQHLPTPFWQLDPEHARHSVTLTVGAWLAAAGLAQQAAAHSGV